MGGGGSTFSKICRGFKMILMGGVKIIVVGGQNSKFVGGQNNTCMGVNICTVFKYL